MVMGLHRETKRAIDKEVEEHPELYEALAGDDDDDADGQAEE